MRITTRVMDLWSWTNNRRMSQEIQSEVPIHLWGPPKRTVLSLLSSWKSFKRATNKRRWKMKWWRKKKAKEAILLLLTSLTMEFCIKLSAKGWMIKQSKNRTKKWFGWSRFQHQEKLKATSTKDIKSLRGVALTRVEQRSNSRFINR